MQDLYHQPYPPRQSSCRSCQNQARLWRLIAFHRGLVVCRDPTGMVLIYEAGMQPRLAIEADIASLVFHREVAKPGHFERLLPCTPSPITTACTIHSLPCRRNRRRMPFPAYSHEFKTCFTFCVTWVFIRSSSLESPVVPGSRRAGCQQSPAVPNSSRGVPSHPQQFNPSIRGIRGMYVGGAGLPSRHNRFRTGERLCMGKVAHGVRLWPSPVLGELT